jgi:soluble lytic murein transglycosylase-like protein
VRYLRYLMNLFNGNLPLVLAAYNAGENAVMRYNNRIPPYPETQTYVKRVLSYLDSYSRKSGSR